MAAELGNNDVIGTAYTEIVKACQRRSLSVAVQQGLTLQDLHDRLSRQQLIIVCYQALIDPYEPMVHWAMRWQDGHYSVVVGMNMSRVLLMDPSQDPGLYGAVPRDEFMPRH